MYITSNESETIYGHNDRQKNNYYFANIDDKGIINIGEELANNQGGFLIARPYAEEQLVKTLNYLKQDNPSFLRMLFNASKKFHLKEFSEVFNINAEDLQKSIERHK